jgi:regulator of protease activity HflC (stomatin/prohibitin superfamily)
MSEEKSISIGIFVFLIIGVLLTLGFDYVPAGYIGVKDTLGTVDDTPWGPGITWTGVLTSTKDFTTRIQLKEYDASSASKDLQIVNTKIALNFKVNPQSTPEIYRTMGLKYQDLIISPIIQEAVKSSTARYTAENLIKERTMVKADITNYIISKLEDKGVIVTEVSITDFMFGPEFNQAIEEKQVAEQRALTAENKYNEMEWTSKSMKLQSEVLEIKKLDLQQMWIEKWNGQLPKIVTSDSGGMFMQINPEIDEQ